MNKNWIEWHGGECPIQGPTQIQLRSGEVFTTDNAEKFNWQHTGWPGDITRYVKLRPYNMAEMQNLWVTSAKLVGKTEQIGGHVTGWTPDSVHISGVGHVTAENLLKDWQHFEGGPCGV